MPFVLQKFAAAFGLIICLLSACLCVSAQAISSQEGQVKLSVIVLDKERHAVTDVSRDALQVSEEGQPQSILTFERDQRPLRLALVVDNTASMRTQWQEVTEATKRIINSKASDDEMMLVRFVDSEHIGVAQAFTNDKERLLAGMKVFSVDEGQSAVIDAIYVTAKKLIETETIAPYRKALVLISDGEDRDSFYKQEQLLKLLRENDVQVFVIGLLTELDKEGGFVQKSPLAKAEELLTKSTQETGGRVFFPRSKTELPSHIEELLVSLRTQYVLSYTPANPKSKDYRKVKVTVAEAPGQGKRAAITRAGYPAARK
jgi:Ca-activated chloride channel family protein